MSTSDDWGVSVVIPVYNGARYLVETLESVLIQTEPPQEIIVVDDGSTDESANIVQLIAASASIPVRYVYQQNQGTAAARNQGIELARSPLIAFLDQDDRWLPQKLARQCAMLRHQPAAGYSITHVELFIDGDGPPPAWVRAKRLEGPQAAYLPSNLLVRQSIFAHVGSFDPSLPNGSDTDWFARVRDAGIEVAVVHDVLVQYRVHSGNQSQFVSENQRDLCVAVRKALLRKRLPKVTVDEGLDTLQ